MKYLAHLVVESCLKVDPRDEPLEDIINRVDKVLEANLVMTPMTLRQQYAMAAMQGFIVRGTETNGFRLWKDAFEAADNMIKFEQQERSCLSKEKKDG